MAHVSWLSALLICAGQVALAIPCPPPFQLKADVEVRVLDGFGDPDKEGCQLISFVDANGKDWIGEFQGSRASGIPGGEYQVAVSRMKGIAIKESVCIQDEASLVVMRGGPVSDTYKLDFRNGRLVGDRSDYSSLRVRLIELSGKKVFDYPVTRTGEFTIRYSRGSPGMYVLVVLDGSQVITTNILAMSVTAYCRLIVRLDSPSMDNRSNYAPCAEYP